MSTMHPATKALALRRAATGSSLWLEASGDSMGRLIVPGDRVAIVATTRPRRGQVWAFCDARGDVLVHRCRGRRGGLWLFQGDARGRPDRPVSEANLVGRVTAIDHAGRRRPLGRRDRLLRGFPRLAWLFAASAVRRILTTVR